MNRSVNKWISKISPWFISIVSIIVLHRFWEALFSTILVGPIFSSIRSSLVIDIAFIALALFVFVLIAFKSERYYLSTNFVFMGIGLSLSYLWYRLNGTVWKFEEFYLWPRIFYADMLLLIGAACLLLWLRILFRTKISLPTKNIFFNDSPLEGTKPDLLGYKDYAVAVANGIKKSGFDQSYAIGVNAKWGMGKTSFLNLVKAELSGEKIILVEFNAWQTNDSKSLLQEFFKAIEKSLAPYSLTLQYKIARYSHKFKDLSDNAVTRTINVAFDSVYQDGPISQIHSEINQALKEIGYKLVIFIDDVDRLGTEEIIELVRLIRNTANFYNTFFVVAYDRSYILKALAVNNIHNYEEFLEKIFQVEVHLPGFDKTALIKLLNENMVASLPEPVHEQFENAMYSRGFNQVNLLHQWLVNVRDVNRLSNAIVLNLNRLQNEIDVVDFLHLELLRLKFPTIYDLLHKERWTFLTVNADNGQERRLVLVTEKEQATKIGNYISKYHQQLTLPKSEVPKVSDLLNKLFDRYKTLNYLSIANPTRFELYFAYKVVDSVLPEGEFVSALMTGGEEFHSRLKIWVAGNMEDQLIARFGRIHHLSNRDEFETVIHGIFYLANLQSAFPVLSRYDYVGYDLTDLLNKLTLTNSKIIDWYGSLDNYAKFLHSIFSIDNVPKPFNAKFLDYVVHDVYRDNVWILKNDTVDEILQGYLIQICSIEEKFNRRILHFYNCCVEFAPFYYSPGGARKERSAKREAKEVLSDFVLSKGLDSFLLFSVVKDLYSEETFEINGAPLKIWNSIQDYQEVLASLDTNKSPYLTEYLKFLNQWIDNGQQPTKFKFEQIPVEEIGPK